VLIGSSTPPVDPPPIVSGAVVVSSVVSSRILVGSVVVVCVSSVTGAVVATGVTGDVEVSELSTAAAVFSTSPNKLEVTDPGAV
jgi:hypothetical protein